MWSLFNVCFEYRAKCGAFLSNVNGADNIRLNTSNMICFDLPQNGNPFHQSPRVVKENS